MNFEEEWQKFETEYNVSDRWQEASQIIFMAFEAGFKIANRSALDIALGAVGEDDGAGVYAGMYGANEAKNALRAEIRQALEKAFK